MRWNSVGRPLRLVLPAVGLACVSCGSNGDDPGGPPSAPPPPNQQPTVTIAMPADGATFPEGEAVSFSGSATDPEDGALTGPALVWTSGNAGQIGTGADVSRDDLSAGPHPITLTATDGDGLSGTAQVSITIDGNDAPDATIDGPSDGAEFAIGTLVSFSGSAMDPEDGELSGSSLVWTSDIDGQIGTDSDFARNDLSAGNHLIRLVATDAEGLADTAEVSAIVLPADSVVVGSHVVLLPGHSAADIVVRTLLEGEPVADPSLSIVSRDTAVATVFERTVLPVSPGATDIVATTDEAADSLRVAVASAGGAALLLSDDAQEFASPGLPGETVTLSLRLLRPGVVYPLASIEGSVQWDPAVLSFEASTVVEPGWSWFPNHAAPDRLSFSGFSAEGTTESFILAELEFTVLGESGASTPLLVTVDVAGDADGFDVTEDVIAVDGVLEVR